jgi:hypothetical protein
MGNETHVGEGNEGSVNQSRLKVGGHAVCFILAMLGHLSGLRSRYNPPEVPEKRRVLPLAL